MQVLRITGSAAHLEASLDLLIDHLRGDQPRNVLDVDGGRTGVAVIDRASAKA